MAEAWTPRVFPPETLAEPGQRYGDQRYLDRFEAVHAELARGFKGITIDGHVEPGLFPLRSTGASTRLIREAANALLTALGRRGQFSIDAREWHLWHGLFTRLLRHGVCVEDMDQRQRQALANLLRASLSGTGFRAIEDIRKTNQLSGELTGLFRDLGADVYWVSIMGEPSDAEPWGWQLDGHHVNINYFVLGDQVVMTPIFLGAEPTNVRTGPLAGLRLFEAEESRALTLFRALSPAQRTQATIAATLEPELFTGFFRDNVEVAPQGIVARELSGRQRQLLVELLSAYVGYLRQDHAELRMRDVVQHLDRTWFAWSGGFSDTSPFSYRIQSPVILIEFSHIFGVAMQGNGPSRNHIHTVVRTPNGNDYGKDLLRQHIERAHLTPI